jgi:hypothetical protein
MINFVKPLLIAFLLGFALITKGQEDQPIVTDRPSQSASAFVESVGAVLIETGFVSEKVTEGLTNLTYLNAHIRWGVINGVELRLTQNIVGAKILDEKTNGLSPIILGTKVHLTNEKGIIPQLSVIGQVTLKSGSDDFKPESSIFETRLIFQNTLSETFTLGYNLGYADTDFNKYLYSVILGVGVADGLSLFVEPYGFFGDDMDQRFDAGILYLANPSLQFDFTFGSGLSDISPDSFVGFGAALRLN